MLGVCERGWAEKAWKPLDAGFQCTGTVYLGEGGGPGTPPVLPSKTLDTVCKTNKLFRSSLQGGSVFLV
jgi:hypothetical protein